MQQLSKQPAFELGQIVATPDALAAAKLETFRINGLMEAASEQAVGTEMGTAGRIN